MPQLKRVCGMSTTRDSSTKLFGSTYPGLASCITSVGQIHGVKLVCYQTRHSGARIHRARGVRALDRIRQQVRFDIRKDGATRLELASAKPCTESLLRGARTAFHDNNTSLDQRNERIGRKPLLGQLRSDFLTKRISVMLRPPCSSFSII